LIVAAAACNGSSSTSTGDGSMVVVINVPVGGAAAVNVAGPSAYSQNLTATGTLAVIPTGIYIITANPARIGDPIVSQVDTGVAFYDNTGDSGTTISVQLNSNVFDTVVVNYRPRPGSGFLWTASAASNGLNRVNGFYSAQLQNFQPGALPAVSVDGGGQGTPGPVAVDASGNLWVATATPSVGQYQYAQLLKGTVSGPSGTILTQIPTTPLAMAFDPAGDLWLAIPGQLVEYAAGALTGMPADTFDLPQLTAAPTGIAFDNLGNLWVAASGTGAIVQLSSARLTHTPGTADSVLLTGVGVVAPLLDPSGRLWVVTTSNTVLGFSAAQAQNFSSTTVPAQMVTISTSGSPTAAAFDNSQDLWVAEGTGNTVVEITFNQLTSGGAQAPVATITPPVPNVTGMAFNPKGQFLPLAGSHTVAPLSSGTIHHAGSPGA
jgi:sugar lactone lactonase YvrE